LRKEVYYWKMVTEKRVAIRVGKGYERKGPTTFRGKKNNLLRKGPGKVSSTRPRK